MELILWSVWATVIAAGAVPIYLVAFHGWKKQGQHVQRPLSAYSLAVICALFLAVVVPMVALIAVTWTLRVLVALDLYRHSGGDNPTGAELFMVSPLIYLAVFAVGIVRSPRDAVT